MITPEGKSSIYNTKEFNESDSPLDNIRLRLEEFYRRAENGIQFFSAINQFISAKSNVDLSLYRTEFLQRRIYYRLVRLNIGSYADYLSFLKQNPNEIKDFIKIFNIHVTEFFRDEKPFRYLETSLLPRISRMKDNFKDKPIRILSAPCSTGDEPYSLAIIAEYLHRKNFLSNPVEIWACDIDPNVIDFARQGIFTKDTLRNISLNSLHENFTCHDEDHYEIKPHLKKYIHFFTQDLLKPLDLDNFDLILCRNFLIYISKQHQKIVINNLIQCMKRGGYLMLGKTEGFPLLNVHIFTPDNLREHIYIYSPQ